MNATQKTRILSVNSGDLRQTKPLYGVRRLPDMAATWVIFNTATGEDLPNQRPFSFQESAIAVAKGMNQGCTFQLALRMAAAASILRRMPRTYLD